MSSSTSTSSSALCYFPRSASDSNFGVAASCRGAMDLATVGEGEFAFLESKPGLLDQRGARAGGKPGKGRRHAGEAVLRRKLANQAFLVKIGGGGAGGKELGGGGSKRSGGGGPAGGSGGCWSGGHRRRGRVLSELMADQFAPSVPYSLNRKSRWARDGTDWLSELAGGSSGRKLRLSLSEADYSLDGTESFRALHRLDVQSGLMQSRFSKSGRGALLADLQKAADEEVENEADAEEGDEAEEGEEEADEGNNEKKNVLAMVTVVDVENEEPPRRGTLAKEEVLHFHLARPHLVPSLFGGKFFKRVKETSSFRSAKRSAIELSSSSSYSSSSSTAPTRSSNASSHPAKAKTSRLLLAVTESEPEEENEFLAQYRPKRETYSLADFVKDNNNNISNNNSSGQQGGRRKACSSSSSSSSAAAAFSSLTGVSAVGFEEIEEDGQYAIVPQMECVELPDFSGKQSPPAIGTPTRATAPFSIPQTSSNGRHLFLQSCPILADLRQRVCHPVGEEENEEKVATNLRSMHRLPLTSNWPEIVQFLGGKKAAERWHPQWLGERLLALDLSWALRAGTTAPPPENQTLVLVLSPEELFVNSFIPLDERKLQAALLAKTTTSAEQRICALLEAVRPDFVEWELSHQSRQHLAPFENLRGIFHSSRLAFSLRPVSSQSILERQREEQGREDRQFVGAEEFLAAGKINEDVLAEDGEKDEEFDDDVNEAFEVIDMSELLDEVSAQKQQQQQDGNKQQKQFSSSSSPSPSLSRCACCNENSNSSSSLAMLRSCGHRFCRGCLGKNVQQQLTGCCDDGLAVGSLHCPICASTLPLDVLVWLLPLASVNALCVLHHANEQQETRPKFAQCPGCRALLEGQPLAEFGHLVCARCSLNWCPKCEGEPHWPLSCAQCAEWNRRLRPSDGEQQQSVPNNNQKGQVALSGPTISGQFVELCAESRARRMDTRLGWQLGKHIRRLLPEDSQVERRFGVLRKTSLHILEFGTAWLYLHRQQRPRPMGWSQLKSLLWALRDRVECVDNELLFSGSLTDAEQLRARLADLEQLSEKCLTKFGATLRGMLQQQQ